MCLEGYEVFNWWKSVIYRDGLFKGKNSYGREIGKVFECNWIFGVFFVLCDKWNDLIDFSVV